MKKAIISFLLIAILLMIPINVLAVEDGSIMNNDQMQDESLNEETEQSEVKSEFYEAKVIKVEEKPMEDQALLDQGFPDTMQIVTVKILKGPFTGEERKIDNINTGNAAYDLWVDRGDNVVLYAELSDDETEITDLYISDFIRWPYIRNLSILFILLLIVIGKWQGIKALISLGITGLAIIQFMLPLMLKGYSPILLAIIVCIFTTIGTVVIITGFTTKSFSTILGSLSGVLIAGFLSYIVGNAIKLTGLSAQEAQMLMYIPQGITFDFKGLLFAGIIIGALGAVMDVAMSISSAMEEIKNTKANISTKELVKSGLSVGKDIMGTMSNTLILAYTGSAIPLLLLFMAYETSFLKVINLDLIATEIIRALTGSIGLLSSIPITAVIYGLFQRKKA